MNSVNPNQQKTKYLFRIWHRRLGVFSALFVLWLALSGFLLNHGDDLDLNESYSKNEVVKALYGLKLEAHQVSGFLENDIYYYSKGGILFLSPAQGAKGIETASGRHKCQSDIARAVSADSQLIILCGDRFIIFTENGELIENVSFSTLGHDINDVAVNDSGELLVQSNGLIYTLDLVSFEFAVAPEMKLTKAGQLIPLAVPETIANEANDARYVGMSFERILMDAHSGRIFGRVGVYFVDLMALVFVVLALSGVYLFLKNKGPL